MAELQELKDNTTASPEHVAEVERTVTTYFDAVADRDMLMKEKEDAVIQMKETEAQIEKVKKRNGAVAAGGRPAVLAAAFPSRPCARCSPPESSGPDVWRGVGQGGERLGGVG